MTDMESKDAKLNAFLKEQVRTNLLNIGRKLVIQKDGFGSAATATGRSMSKMENSAKWQLHMNKNILSIMSAASQKTNMGTFGWEPS